MLFFHVLLTIALAFRPEFTEVAFESFVSRSMSVVHMPVSLLLAR